MNLLNQVNDLLSINKFQKAFNKVNSHLGKGKMFWLSHTNRELRQELKNFRKTYESKFLGTRYERFLRFCHKKFDPNLRGSKLGNWLNNKLKSYAQKYSEISLNDVSEMSRELQRLAIKVERRRVPGWFNLNTIAISVLTLLLTLLISDVFNQYALKPINNKISIPRYSSNNKQKLLIYDLNQFTDGGTYNLEEMLNDALNDSKKSLWSNFFEAKRIKSEHRYDESHIHEPWKNEYLRIIQNGYYLFGSFLGKEKKADKAITGFAEKNNDGTSLILEAINNGDTTELEIGPIKSFRQFLKDPCSFYEFTKIIEPSDTQSLYLLIDKIENYDNICKDSLNQIKLVDNIASLTMRSASFFIKEKKKDEQALSIIKYFLTNISKENFPSAVKIICTDLANNNISLPEKMNTVCIIKEPEPEVEPIVATPISKLYKEINKIEYDASKVKIDVTKNPQDEILITVFFKRGKKRFRGDSLLTAKYLRKVKLIYDENNSGNLSHHADGYTCSIGDPDYPNTKLSERRARKVLNHFGHKLSRLYHQKDKLYSAHGASYPIKSPPTNEDNRRATIKFFESKTKTNIKPKPVQINHTGNTPPM